MSDAAVLLVEDNDLDARLLTNALQKALPGLNVERATDGEAGLEALETSRPQLVILDISMPGLDGMDVLEQIRQNEKTSAMPVIMCSNSDSPSDVLRSYKQNANAYVQKPDSRAAYDELAESLTRFWFEQSKLPW